MENKFKLYNELAGTVTCFEEMLGKVPVDIIVDTDSMTFVFTDTNKVRFYHSQDCCESVYIEDICGDINDLIGCRLLVAEEVSTEVLPGDVQEHVKDYENNADSCTWTFYRFATQKGDVTVRWLGESNGYYSESVDVEFLTE